MSVDVKGRFLRLIVQLLGLLPLWLSRKLGAALGHIGWWLQTRAAKVTQENLALCFPSLPEAERRHLARASLCETSKGGVEMAAVWTKPYHWLERKILSEHNRELLDNAIAAPEGVIVLVPHLGNWEIFGPYLSHITQMTALYQPPKLEAMEQLIRASRERTGAKLVPTNRRGVMGLVKALKKGGLTVILPDQVPDGGAGEFVPFFGVPARTMTLVHSQITRIGCRVIMGYAKRVPGGFALVFAEPDADIYSDDVETSLAAMNRSVEACVKDAPEQYQWEYKRFKKQPAGMEKRYRF